MTEERKYKLPCGAHYAIAGTITRTGKFEIHFTTPSGEGEWDLVLFAEGTRLMGPKRGEPDRVLVMHLGPETIKSIQKLGIGDSCEVFEQLAGPVEEVSAD